MAGPGVKMKYKYPPADKMIVSNIARACLHHPQFYYQVCHLMNRMNLMPPFIPISSNFAEDVNADLGKITSEPKCSSDEESEIESDGNYAVNQDNCRFGTSFKRDRKKLQVGILGEVKKKPKSHHDEYLPISFDRSDQESLEDLIKVNSLQPVSIKINIQTETLTSKSQQGYHGHHPRELDCIETVQSQGFGLISRTNNETKLQTENETNDWIELIVTDDELTDKRLLHHQLITVPAYKDYSPGTPSCRLYLKNLAKNVTELDLKRLFGRYINLKSECDRNMFHVQLFKSGRFRNQAFISLPNEEASSLALKETNGYIIDGKPIIVSFARSIKAKTNT